MVFPSSVASVERARPRHDTATIELQNLQICNIHSIRPVGVCPPLRQSSTTRISSLNCTMGPRRKASNGAASSSAEANAEAVEISIPNDSLYRDLASHNSYFDNLVDMLPSKLYIAGNTGDEMYNPKYKHGQHKESKEARRARNKAARLQKFQSPETTLEKKARLAREEAEMDMDSSDSDGSDSEVEGGKAGKKRRMKKNAAKSKQQGTKKAGAWAGDSDDDIVLSKDQPKNTKTSKSADSETKAEGNDDGGGDAQGEGGTRIEALRARLRAKIAERQSQRPGGVQSPDAVSKRAARRAEKQRRVEAAKKRADKGGSTRVGKSDAKKYKVSDAELGGTVVNTGSGTKSTSREEDLAGVDFGGIAGLSKKATYLDNKSLAKSGGKKKSLDRLLADAEKKRDRLQELKAGTEEDKEKAMRIQWGDTLKEATGERVRDDPALIRKAMKRKAKKKAKSAKAWEARTEQLMDAKDQKQKIRSHNLEKRKLGGTVAANLSKKRIAAEEDKDTGGKKEKRPRLGPYAGTGTGGKSRAGFEGKRQAFINEAKPKGKKQ